MSAKVQYRRLTPEQRSRHLSLLIGVMQQCGLTGDGQNFLQDLLTQSEVIMIARRIQIARRLLSGESFPSIHKELRVGLNTIAAVARWLDRKPEVYRFVISVPG